MDLKKNFGLFAERTSEVSLAECPNPKPTAADKRAFGKLASLYTAFSGEFAVFALEYMLSRGCRTIGDPFAGMGTLGEAARGLPTKLFLNDFNPFAVSAAVFRTAATGDIEEAIEKVLDTAKGLELDGAFDPYLLAMRQVLPEGETARACLGNLEEYASRHAVLCMHLLSVARIAAQKKRKGSNPTWTKKQTEHGLADLDFHAAIRSAAQLAKIYSASLAAISPHFSCRISNEDVTSVGWASGSMDAIITSPPYPNRTDYIRHYLPAAEMLLDFNEDAERHLRETQIGTPLIRKDGDLVALPKSVDDLIERIRTHPSYASERYYSKGFRYYFEDMARALRNFSDWLVSGGSAMLVVQDAYYKDVLVRTAELLSHVAEDCGFIVDDIVEFPVRNSMSRLSPQFRATTPKPALFETVIVLKKP